MNNKTNINWLITINGDGTDFEYYEWSENKSLDDVMEINALELLKKLIEKDD